MEIGVLLRVLVALWAMGDLAAPLVANENHPPSRRRSRRCEEMTRITAGVIVAPVADIQAAANQLKVRQLPGGTVGGRPLLVEPELPVAVCTKAGLPHPAVIRTTDVHLRPEPDLEV